MKKKDNTVKFQNEQLKVSFDFDGVLTKERYQEVAKRYIYKDIEVFIVTSRDDSENRNDHDCVFDLADEIGISHENIIFTRHKPKYEFLKYIDIHYDDDELEIELMEENFIYGVSCLGILVK